jgi:hypothetical protein
MENSNVILPIENSQISSKCSLLCSLCFESSKYLMKKLSCCEHSFHHSCLIKIWTENPLLMKKCPVCCKTTNINETYTTYKNIPDFYQNILCIQREQCSHIYDNGIQCKNYEYPWRLGKCKHHTTVHFDNNAERDIIMCFESSLYIHDYFNIKNILKLHFLIQFFLIRSTSNPIIYSNKINIATDMGNIMKKHNSITGLYHSNGLQHLFNDNVLNKLGIKIKF